MPGKRTNRKPPPQGISERHTRGCALSHGGERCNCEPSYVALVYDKRRHKRERKTFSGPGALAAAKLWRADALSALGKGRDIGPSKLTLRQAAEAWLAGAKADPPTALTRSGRPYKPSALRGYEADLAKYVLPDLGARKLSDVRRRDLQALIDELVGRGLSGSKVRNILVPVRVVFRRALEDEDVAVNPTTALRMPNGHDDSKRDRVASPQEASELLAALPADLRPIYATAFYAGLRRGELRALRFEDIDLAAGRIHVRRGWDDQAGEIEPKSKAGTRRVPVAALLRDYLDELKLTSARDGRDFVFGRTADRPFTPTHIARKAAKAWKAANERRAEEAAERGEPAPKPLEPIGLHECRHTFASLLIEAGVNFKKISTYMGHSSITITLDLYGHLLPGIEDEDAKALDAYLARADTGSRLAQLAGDDTDTDEPNAGGAA